jgi:Tfp pilus assembly protein PilF
VPDLLVQDALWKLSQHKIPEARASLEEALKLNPADSRSLEFLGQSYLAQKQPAEAVQKVKEYAAKQPNNARMQQFLGVLLMAKGDAPQARAAFTAALAANPKLVEADLSLAQLDVIERKPDEARKRLEAILANDAKNAMAHRLLASIEDKKGNYNGAIDHFRKAVDGDPGDADAMNNLAYLLAEHGNQLDEALKFAERAVELAPERPAYCDTLGWVLYRKGLYSPAVKYLERASASPGSVVWKYHLAMAYAQAGDAKRGKTTLDAALRINPNLPEAKTAEQVVGKSH